MSPVKRIIGIAVIFCVASIGWMVLGGVMTSRTEAQTGALSGEVSELWGQPQAQKAPTLVFHWTTWEDQVRKETVNDSVKTIRERVAVEHSENVSPISTDINVGLHLDQRLKGLVWYSLYAVDFAGTWHYRHDLPQDGWLEVIFTFADPQGLYDAFHLSIAGQDRAQQLRPDQGKVSTRVAVKPGADIAIGASYTSRGQSTWQYVPSDGVARLEAFKLAMTTDFADIDYPPQSMSPSSRERDAGGWKLGWQFDRVITGRSIGMFMPTRIQPGAMASQLAFSAPISLLFFFMLIYVLATLRKIDIHPVNYMFLAGAFFAFHLLFGYSVDHISLIPAFVVASLTSIVLVVTYLRLVVSARFALVEAALAQVVYLVGFSLAHFWEGYTGLTVTILAIVTLFVLMQLTGRRRWKSSTPPPDERRAIA